MLNVGNTDWCPNIHNRDKNLSKQPTLNSQGVGILVKAVTVDVLSVRLCLRWNINVVSLVNPYLINFNYNIRMNELPVIRKYMLTHTNKASVQEQKNYVYPRHAQDMLRTCLWTQTLGSQLVICYAYQDHLLTKWEYGSSTCLVDKTDGWLSRESPFPTLTFDLIAGDGFRTQEGP